MKNVTIYAVLAPGEVILETDNSYILCIYENDEKLRRESGWYIKRITAKDSFYWEDYARPGWGVTYWIYQDVANKLWLDLVRNG